MTSGAGPLSMPQSASEARVVDTAKVWLKRGIELDGRPAQIRMAKVGGAVVTGANAATAPEVSYDRITCDMDAVDPELRGFAWEGVGTALTTGDIRSQTASSKRSVERGLTLRANAVAEANPTWRKWIIMGVGLGFGRTLAHAAAGADAGPKWSEAGGACLSELVRRTLEFVLSHILSRDAVDAMLICDGLGMALASGDPDNWLVPGACFSRLAGEMSSTGDPAIMKSAERGFDQGVGRAVWFVNCGEPEKIISTLSTFGASERIPDLWGGVGFAGTYAGGVSEAQWRDLVARAPAARGYLAQAAACVANSRLNSSGVFQETEIGCRATWDRSIRDALIELQNWFENPSDASIAAAPNGWRHVRFLTEFPDQAR
jgi:Protein of unknown function (DUF1702)